MATPSRALVVGLSATLTLAFAFGVRTAHGSIFGEENITLVKQLAELMKIHDELTKVSEAAQRNAEATQNIVEIYAQAQAGNQRAQGLHD